MIQTSIPALRGIVGLSLNKYSAKFEGVEIANIDQNVLGVGSNGQPITTVDDHRTEPEHHFPIRDTGGLKGGFRLGFEYSFNKSLSADVIFQQTELAGQNTSDPVQRAGGVNPSWLQVGVHYSF